MIDIKYSKDYLKLIDEDVKSFEQFIIELDKMFFSSTNNVEYANFLNSKFSSYDESELAILMKRPTLSFVMSFINFCSNQNAFTMLNNLEYRFIIAINVDIKVLLAQIESIIDNSIYNKLSTIYLSLINLSECVRKQTYYEEKTQFFCFQDTFAEDLENNTDEDDEFVF